MCLVAAQPSARISLVCSTMIKKLFEALSALPPPVAPTLCPLSLPTSCLWLFLCLPAATSWSSPLNLVASLMQQMMLLYVDHRDLRLYRDDTLPEP